MCIVGMTVQFGYLQTCVGYSIIHAMSIPHVWPCSQILMSDYCGMFPIFEHVPHAWPYSLCKLFIFGFVLRSHYDHCIWAWSDYLYAVVTKFLVWICIMCVQVPYGRSYSMCVEIFICIHTRQNILFISLTRTGVLNVFLPAYPLGPETVGWILRHRIRQNNIKNSVQLYLHYLRICFVWVCWCYRNNFSPSWTTNSQKIIVLDLSFNQNLHTPWHPWGFVYPKLRTPGIEHDFYIDYNLVSCSDHKLFSFVSYCMFYRENATYGWLQKWNVLWGNKYLFCAIDQTFLCFLYLIKFNFVLKDEWIAKTHMIMLVACARMRACGGAGVDI